MGIFLSSPSTEVSTDLGSGAGLNFAVGEMQGWRKNMEDAHIASPGFMDKNGVPISLFGVFDGHGGKEVSAFVKLKYLEVLTSLQSFQEGKYDVALRESFHKIDELLEDPEYATLLKQLRAVPNPSELANGASNLPKQPASAPVVRPLSAPNRSASPESDDGDEANSPLPKERDVDSITIIKQLLEGAKQYSRAKNRNDTEEIAAAAASLAGNLRNLKAARSASASEKSDGKVASTHETKMIGTTPSAFADEDDGEDADVENNLERDSEDSFDSEYTRKVESSETTIQEESSETETTITLTTTTTSIVTEVETEVKNEESTDSDLSSDAEEALSAARHVVVTKPVAVLETVTSDTTTVSVSKISPPKFSNNPFKGETYQSVFSERVNEDVVTEDPETELGKSPKHPPALKSVDNDEPDTPSNAEPFDSSSEDDLSPPKAANRLKLSMDTTVEETSSSNATSGRPPAPANFTTYTTSGTTNVCQLKDHRVLAGCTAIVVMLVGNQLIVANAGDSRAVLCRNGIAVGLSDDHKPSQDREISRIKNAGGFVNMVGRVNGNLNLSRSLGDLKYKQVKHLPPEAQMITAEPDIEIFEIDQDDDEFVILACDGIWDVLSNQDACDFVRQKVFEEKMSLEEVVHAVMKRCIAKDPRVSQGIGGDNMTFMVVWLNADTMPPTSRSAAAETNTTQGSETAAATAVSPSTNNNREDDVL